MDPPKAAEPIVHLAPHLNRSRERLWVDGATTRTRSRLGRGVLVLVGLVQRVAAAAPQPLRAARAVGLADVRGRQILFKRRGELPRGRRARSAEKVAPRDVFRG